MVDFIGVYDNVAPPDMCKKIIDFFEDNKDLQFRGRYLIDGWEYTFNQFKANYKNWFFQTYVNNSYSGNTRGYILGDRIQDYSSNTAYQLQHNFKIKPILNGYISDTKVTWGVDYFKTKPVTNGTILNDGPNGRDEDGDGQIDEIDEFDNTLAEEIGLYFQTCLLYTSPSPRDS